MPFNCRLSRNITVNQSVDDPCSNVEMMAGGIADRFYIFNIDDIDGLKFQNDNRSDDNLYVDTIITSQPYYYVDGSGVSYSESQDGAIYTHQLTANVNNIQGIIQDILSDAAPNKYLVCFKPLGSSDWRCFGWEMGATLSHTLDISESASNYVLTFSDESENPLFSVKSDNFNLSNKQFDPHWKPLYEVSGCQLDEHGMQTGWCLALYVVKVNSAGQPLDASNKLCEYTGQPQDAYKYYTAPDGDYHIIGTYQDDAVYEGAPVLVFNPEICLPESEGTISFDEEVVRLNSTTRQYATAELTSNAAWAIVSTPPEYCTVSPNTGDGNATLSFYYGRFGGDDVITVRNLNSYEETGITVHNRTLIVGVGEEFPYGTEGFNIYCRAYGGSESYTVQVDNPGLTLTPTYDSSDGEPVLVGYDAVVNDPTVQTTRSWTFTFTHDDDNEEVKTATYTILAMDTTPYWRLMRSYCEES